MSSTERPGPTRNYLASSLARERQKQRAAELAASLVESGMVIGLGGGTTAAHALPALSKRIQEGELSDVLVVPVSAEVGARAALMGLRIVMLSERPRVDITIDGADEVDPELRMLKGKGGRLLYEKMLAQAASRQIIVVDESKLSNRLGTQALLAVEVLAHGWRSEELFLRELGGHPRLRTSDSGRFLTDEGNLILDCDFGGIDNPSELSARLDTRAGIAGHGLFIGLASEVLVGNDSEIRRLRPPRVGS